jgi:hypothetical protein
MSTGNVLEVRNYTIVQYDILLCEPMEGATKIPGKTLAALFIV